MMSSYYTRHFRHTLPCTDGFRQLADYISCGFAVNILLQRNTSPRQGLCCCIHQYSEEESEGVKQEQQNELYEASSFWKHGFIRPNGFEMTPACRRMCFALTLILVFPAYTLWYAAFSRKQGKVFVVRKIVVL